jgi:hypothetical protein
MPPAVADIAGMWLKQASEDPSWLEWLRDRHSQSFVILTLCRMLYSLATGDVASKPTATRWARITLGAPWADLIARSLAMQHDTEALSQRDEDDTIAFIRYTLQRSRASSSL